MLLRFTEIAEDKVYVNYDGGRKLTRHLRMVDCTEEVASSVRVGESDDADEDRERWSAGRSGDIIDDVVGNWGVSYQEVTG